MVTQYTQTNLSALQSFNYSSTNNVQERKSSVATQKQGISPKVDTVNISFNNQNSTLPSESSLGPTIPVEPTEPADPTRPIIIKPDRPEMVVVEKKDPAKMMFANAEDHEQFEMVGVQIAEDQITTQLESLEDNGSEEEDSSIYDNNSEDSVFVVSQPTLYEKVLNSYRQQTIV